MRGLALLGLLALGGARAAAADGSCAAGSLRLNKTVFMQETSWYEYARRVAAGVTVIIPVGATEQARGARCPARPAPLPGG